MKYVVDYQVVKADDTVRHIGQRDVDTTVDLDTPNGRGARAALLITEQIVLHDGDRIVVTDIRHA